MNEDEGVILMKMTTESGGGGVVVLHPKLQETMDVMYSLTCKQVKKASKFMAPEQIVSKAEGDYASKHYTVVQECHQEMADNLELKLTGDKPSWNECILGLHRQGSCRRQSEANMTMTSS